MKPIPKIVAEPDELLSIDECRQHLNVQPYTFDSDGVGSHPDDAMIMLLQGSARRHCENYLEHSIGIQTLEIALDSFPGTVDIELQRPPIIDVISVVYLDVDGDEQTIASSLYVLDDRQFPGWVVPIVGTSWPTVGPYINAVKVRYVAGYSNDTDGTLLPKEIRGAMLLMLGHLYANREAVAAGAMVELPLGVTALLNLVPTRVRIGMA